MNKQDINKEETDLIRSIFSGNDNLLKSMRALFFGLDISKTEKDLIRGTFENKELLRIMWKRFYPTLEKDSPIGQVQDVWLGVEQMIFGQAKDTITQAVLYKEEALKMTQKALELLVNPEGESFDLEYRPFVDSFLKVGLLARNQYIRHIESQLLALKTIADMKDETPEQTKRRLGKDSAK